MSSRMSLRQDRIARSTSVALGSATASAVARNQGPAYAKESRHSLRISHEPSLRLSDGDTETHPLGWVWQPGLPHRRRTVLLKIEIDQDYPRTVPRGGVITTNPLPQLRLPLLPMHGPGDAASIRDESLDHRLVHNPFHSCQERDRRHRLLRITEQRQLLGIVGGSTREHSLSERDSACQQIPHVIEVLREVDIGTIGCRD